MSANAREATYNNHAPEQLAHGYLAFELGSFRFRRDEYFAHISWMTRDGRPMSHTMDIGSFLRALMRDVAWGFFYGWVNFDEIIGTVNRYESFDLYAGSYNGSMKVAGVDRIPRVRVRPDDGAQFVGLGAHRDSRDEHARHHRLTRGQVAELEQLA